MESFDEYKARIKPLEDQIARDLRSAEEGRKWRAKEERAKARRAAPAEIERYMRERGCSYRDAYRAVMKPLDEADRQAADDAAEVAHGAQDAEESALAARIERHAAEHRVPYRDAYRSVMRNAAG